MTWWMTSYPPWPNVTSLEPAQVGAFGFHLWASKRRNAEDLCRLRNIGETLICRDGSAVRPPYPLASEMIFRTGTRERAMQVVHTATFLSYLAQRALGSDAASILGDQGLLHAVVHCLIYGDPSRAIIAERLRVVEREIPGYLPPRWKP